MKGRKGSWKADYLKQRRKDAHNPDLKAYKYTCPAGHIRIEKGKLPQDQTQCPACSKEGKDLHFRLLGPYTLPRSQAKKSRF